MRHISPYKRGVICLTSVPRPSSLGDLIDKRSQVHKIIRTQPRPASRALRERVGLDDIRPGSEQRAQAPLIVEEHHPILTPVLLARSQDEAPATPWMEWVRDLELYDCAIV